MCSNTAPPVDKNWLRLIYRSAIDESVESNSVHWWSKVYAELQEVIRANSDEDAAKVIDWWHSDWSLVGDTALQAAQRIREWSRKIQRPEAIGNPK